MHDVSELSITTPAMFFPTISLLLLAYGNRYLTISNRIRSLFDSYQTRQEDVILLQISSLRARLRLIQGTQLTGVCSLLLCVIVIIAIYVKWYSLVPVFFGLSLVLLTTSLVLSMLELYVSNTTLNILLHDIEKDIKSVGAKKSILFHKLNRD